MNRIIVVVLLCFAVLAGTVQAQAPKPGPEHEKLGYLVGTWDGAGESKTDKWTGTSSCEWIAGGFHVACRDEDSTGWSRLVVYSYNATDKIYTASIFNSRGRTPVDRVTIEGNIWKFSERDIILDGKPAKMRTTTTIISPTESTTKIESSIEGGPWTVTAVGKSKRRP